jgi:transketolase
MRDTFIRALEGAAVNHPEVFLMVGDLGFGVVENFEKAYPSQFLNAGIAEQNMMGMAAGMADAGFVPFVYSIANFPTLRCLEQIRNDVCYHNLPVNIVSVGAGLSYGSLGYSHQAIEDISIMRSLPGMRILSPSDPLEVAAAVDLMVSDPAPTYLRLGKNGESKLHENRPQSLKQPLKLREGARSLILATGGITQSVLAALDDSFDVAVFTVPTLKPLDISKLALEEFEHIVTVEEHSIVGGLGSVLLEASLGKAYLPNISVIALSDSIDHSTGSADHLKEKRGLSPHELRKKFIAIGL